tara:strand:- start:1436 stop:2404 length:969 start_codon:yes stop_codon:yes gene_type:complete
MECLEYSFIYLSERHIEDGNAAFETGLKRQGKVAANCPVVAKEMVYTHPFLLPLVKKVACNHPKWRFRSEVMHLTASRKRINCAPEPLDNEDWIELERHVVVSVDVTVKGEKIGEIGIDNNGMEERFKLDSPTLKRGRQRGWMTYTKDLNKASRIVNKSFFPLTLEQRYDKMNRALVETLRSSASRKEGEYNNQWRGVREHLRTHIEENWETFAPISIAAGLDKEIADTFILAKQKAAVLNQLKNDPTCVFVWLEGNQYFIRGRNENCHEIEAYTTDTFPVNYKQKIGMLKMLDDEHAAGGVGYRFHAKSFLIFEGEFDAKG